MAKKSRFDMEVNLRANSAAFKKHMNQAKASVKNFSNSGMQAFGALNSTAGRFIYGFQQAQKTVKGMIPVFKSLKTAVAATGIGAIFLAISAAVAGVYGWLTKTVEGQDKLNIAWTKTKAVGATFFDRMIDGGRGLFKVLMGNKEGIEEIKASFKGVFQQSSEAADKAAQIAREENQLKKDKIDFIVEEAKLNREIAELIRESKNLEYDRSKRLDYINKAQILQDKLSNTRVDLTRRELDLTERKNQLSKSGYEEATREAELKRDLLLIDKERDDKQRELENRAREINGALNEQEKILKKIAADEIKIGQNLQKTLETVKITADVFKEDLSGLKAEMERVLNVTPKVDLEQTKYLKDEFKDINNITNLVGAGIWGVTDAFTQLAMTGKRGMKSMVDAILFSLEGLVQGYLSTMIAGALASEAKKGLLGLVTGSLAIAGFMGLWRANVKDFAEGGIVRGETIARVGEYKRANVDPEVISPLSKLKGMLGGKVKGRLTTEGTQLVALIESVQQQNNIFG